jgi:RNA polymerase sigma-70 factor (ECF subfamily)
MPDDALAAELATDLPGSYERVVVAYQDRLYRFALRMCGNAADARDITQEAFVRAYRALLRYSPERRRALALQAWLYRITLNLTRNHVSRRRPAGVPLESLNGYEPHATDTPATVLLGSERRRVLERVIAGLPERYRAPVVLRHVEALTYEEAAAVLRQPVGTTKANVHRGLALLRRALEEGRETKR